MSRSTISATLTELSALPPATSSSAFSAGPCLGFFPEVATPEVNSSKVSDLGRLGVSAKKLAIIWRSCIPSEGEASFLSLDVADFALKK